MYAVGFMKRYDPGVQLARGKIAEAVGSGELGALRMVDASCFMGDWLENVGAAISVEEDTRPPAVAARYPEHIGPALHAAYDYFINVFAHNVNLIRYLLPNEQVACAGGLAHGQTPALNFTSGEVVISLRGTPVAWNAWREETRFIFDKGIIGVRTPSPMNRQATAKVTIATGHGRVNEERQLHTEVDWCFRRRALGFTAAVLGREKPLAPGEDCLRDVEIMEDVFRKVKFG